MIESRNASEKFFKKEKAANIRSTQQKNFCAAKGSSEEVSKGKPALLVAYESDDKPKPLSSSSCFTKLLQNFWASHLFQRQNAKPTLLTNQQKMNA